MHFQQFAPVGKVGGLEGSAMPTLPGLNANKPSDDEVKSFGAVLKGSLDNVNRTIDGAIVSTDNLLTGDMDSLHEMTIAGAKAEVVLKMTTQVVSKLAQATTQLFQMQL